MRVTSVTYSRVVVVKQYETQRAECTVSVDEGDDPDAAYECAVAFVERKLGLRPAAVDYAAVERVAAALLMGPTPSLEVDGPPEPASGAPRRRERVGVEVGGFTIDATNKWKNVQRGAPPTREMNGTERSLLDRYKAALPPPPPVPEATADVWVMPVLEGGGGGGGEDE